MGPHPRRRRTPGTAPAISASEASSPKHRAPAARGHAPRHRRNKLDIAVTIGTWSAAANAAGGIGLETQAPPFTRAASATRPPDRRAPPPPPAPPQPGESEQSE